MLLMYIFVT